MAIILCHQKENKVWTVYHTVFCVLLLLLVVVILLCCSRVFSVKQRTNLCMRILYTTKICYTGIGPTIRKDNANKRKSPLKIGRPAGSQNVSPKKQTGPPIISPFFLFVVFMCFVQTMIMRWTVIMFSSSRWIHQNQDYVGRFHIFKYAALFWYCLSYRY
jgi:hypothetical protein